MTLIRVAPAVREDLCPIVRVHEEAFEDFFLTKLGPRFLRRYYEAVLVFDRGILLKATLDGCLVGFACGFMQPRRFYFALLRRWLQLGPALASGVLAHPSLLVRVVRTLGRVGRGSAHAFVPPGNEPCELSSLAVEPSQTSRGVGAELVSRFLDVARERGGDVVFVSTDAVGNNRANRFYSRLGFELAHAEERDAARSLNHWVLWIREEGPNLDIE